MEREDSLVQPAVERRITVSNGGGKKREGGHLGKGGKTLNETLVEAEAPP